MIVEISDPDGVIGIKIELPDSGSDASIIESVADNWRNTGEVILTEWVAGEPLGDYEDDSIRRSGAELEDCSLRLVYAPASENRKTATEVPRGQGWRCKHDSPTDRALPTFMEPSRHRATS